MTGENKLTDEKFWDQMWDRSAVDMKLRPFFFTEVIKPIEPSSDKTMIELGCAPGDNLIHLHRLLGHKVSGIDFSEAVKVVPERLKKHGIADADIMQGDIFSYQFKQRYDFVFSMGLVEHFRDPLPVLKKHAELLKPGGWLLIAIPNFRYFHYVIRLIGDYDCLMKHNTLLMSKKRFKRYAAQIGVEIVKCDYHSDFAYWCENNKTDIGNRLRKRIASEIASLVRRVYRHWPFQGRTSCFFSPWVIVLARKSV